MDDFVGDFERPQVVQVTDVSIVVVVPADNSPPTLRAEALSPSNGPTTSVSLASLNLTCGGLAQWICRRTRLLVRGWQPRGSPSDLQERFVAYFGCRVGPGIASEPNCVRSY